MTTPMAPQPDPDMNDLAEGALAESALDAEHDQVAEQTDDLNLTPDAPGPSGTGETA